MAMQFPAGQRTPEKYQSVGPNYMKWGEQEHNGYVYDPTRDAYYYDPMAAARWEAAAKEELAGDQPGIWEQAGAAALPTLTTVGGLAAMNHFLSPGSSGLLGLGSKAATPALAGAGGSVVAPAALTPAVGSGAFAVGTDAATGGIIMSNGTVVAPAAGAGAAPASGGLLGLDKAASTTIGGTPLFEIGEPSVGGYGAGAYEGYNALKALSGPDRDREEAVRRGVLAVGDVFLGGLPSLTYGLLGRNKTAKKIMDFALNPLGEYNPAVMGLRALGIGNKSTKQRQADRLSTLRGKNYTGQNELLDFADKRFAETAGDREQGLRFIDPNGVDSYKLQVRGRDVILNPTYFLSQIAPMDLVKDDYMGKWTHQQRYEFNRRLLAENLYKSEAGGWEITDKERAAQIKADIDKMPSDPNWKSPESKLVKDPGIDNAYDANSPDNSPFPSSSASSGGTQKAASGGGLLGLSSWDDAVKAGKARPGSKEAGGYVIGRQWYPSTAAVPV